MSMIEATQKIRLAPVPPVACSSCGGQYTDRRHVDFGAAWDGPMISAGDESRGVIGHAVDDLIVCEDCLRDAAKLLGWQDITALQTAFDDLRRHQDQVGVRLASALEHVESLERAARSRDRLEEVLRPPRRGPGRPRKDQAG